MGDVAKKLGEKAVKEIKKGFFGGGSSGKSSGGKGKSGGKPFIPPNWGNAGAISTSIPLKGAKYKVASANKCLVASKDKLSFGSCKGTKDNLLFRFSPSGDFVSIGSSTSKKATCLAATGPDIGDKVHLETCTDTPLQKWRMHEKQLSIANGLCAGFDRNSLKLAKCNSSSRTQQFDHEPVADLAALTELPQKSIYTVSYRTPGGSTCIDGADGLLVEYNCDGGDYQVFDLRSSGELRNELECVTASSNRAGTRLGLSKCEGKYKNWEWVGSKMKLKGTKMCLARSTRPGKFGVKPITLAACTDKSAEWDLQPTNVDQKGRILPAHAMIRSSGNLCMEVRSKLQVDQMTIPAAVLWACNGDFNQGFSFRWNGQIRSLGDCLTASALKAGALVKVDECTERQHGLGLAVLLQQGGQQRKKKDNQSWRLTSSGQIKKRGTKLCLSAHPKGLQQIRFDAKNLIRGLKPKKASGKPGGLGSLFTLEKCSSNALQKWVVTNELPDGSIFKGYVRLANSNKGHKRCLETSGDDKFRKVVGRKCNNNSTYQDYALTPYGEIRQMGRCVTTIEADGSYGDGYQLELRECTGIREQKFTRDAAGRLTQIATARAGAANGFALRKLASLKDFSAGAKKIKSSKGKGKATTSVMCITEGQVFDPKQSFPGLPKAHFGLMKKLPTFSLVGVESCAFTYQNAKTKKCMHVGKDEFAREATCKKTSTLYSGQAFGVSHGKLVQRYLDGKKFKLRKLWIDSARSKVATATSVTPDVKGAKGSVIKAVGDTFKNYSNAGWNRDSKSGLFKYSDGKTCLAAPTGKGRLSSNEKKKLEKRFLELTKLIQKTAPKSVASSKERKKLKS